MKIYVDVHLQAELKEDCDCGYDRFGKVREYSKNKDQVLKPWRRALETLSFLSKDPAFWQELRSFVPKNDRNL